MKRWPSSSVLGEGHCNTLHAAKSLTSLLLNTRRHAEAEQLGRAALAQAQRMLGSEHPSTLMMASRLALILGNQGKTAGAETWLKATLANQQRVVGPGHPDTEQTAHYLQHFGQLQSLLLSEFEL